MNLLEETEKALANHNLKLKNIKYVLNREGFIPVAEYVRMARATYYDNEYGEVEIDPSLCIVGQCWWLSREEYDGYEGFVFHKRPMCPTLQAVGAVLKNTRGETYPSGIYEKIEK